MEVSAGRKLILYLLFSLSGFAALVYELIWTKQLALTVGATMIAVSLVAAVFMGGLALGSHVIGRYSDRHTNLLFIYAVLEALIAFFALTFPFVLDLAHHAHVALERAFPAYSGAEHLLHLACVALLLLPPTFCMGGTFPLMCRFFARKKSGGQIGRLYAINTAGAVAGAFTAGYLLIPQLGLDLTNRLAVALNLAIAGVACFLSLRMKAEKPVALQPDPNEPEIAPERRRFALVAIGLIGLFSLAYEILWTRVLLMFLGNTIYAFALILSAFLVGIALGGAIYAYRVSPQLNEKRLFVRLTLLMGLSVLITAPFYDRLAELFVWAHRISGDNWWLLNGISFIIVLGVMLLPTVLSGSLLPAAAALLQTGRSHTGKGVGMVVLSNTVGAMLGSLLAGFLLIPALGAEFSLRLIASLNLLLGAVIYLRYFRGRENPRHVWGMVTVGLVFALLPLRWDQKLMNAGVYCYAPTYARHGGITDVLAPERVLAVYEGKDCTVAVKEIDVPKPTRYFSVNGKTDGGNGGDMGTQILIGQLPVLLHPAPKKSLVIGLGTGITLGAVAAAPLSSIDCVEISDEVVKAAAFFAQENRQALADPRVTLHVQDGRDLLQIHKRDYDVIVSQPSNPWQTGNASLFTREFYLAAADNLAPGGIFSQWIGLYDITPENLKIACRTLLDVFPHTLAFKSGGDLLILASASPLAFDYQTIAARLKLAGIAEVLAEAGIHSPGDLLARHFLLDDGNLRRYAGNAELNTDDRPFLEFSFRYNLGGKMFGRMKEINLAELQGAAQRQQVPLVNLGRSNAEVAAALTELSQRYARAGRGREAQALLDKLSSYETSAVELSDPHPFGG